MSNPWLKIHTSRRRTLKVCSLRNVVALRRNGCFGYDEKISPSSFYFLCSGREVVGGVRDSANPAYGSYGLSEFEVCENTYLLSRISDPRRVTSSLTSLSFSFQHLRHQSSMAMESWPQGYHPSLEWPGTDIDCEQEAVSRSLSSSLQNHSSFRLVVKTSEVLARKRRVAVLDVYDEVQIGRDASTSNNIPRIRLKDMEVSRLHATLFWDREDNGWSIVDMGSKHGTFVRSGFQNTVPIARKFDGSSSELDGAVSASSFTRLSPERQASRPRALFHLDEISIGRTTFVTHVHLAGLPCDECRSEGRLDIPLFSVSSSSMRPQKSGEIAEDMVTAPRDARTVMSLLKKSLLTRHSDAPLKTMIGTSHQYVDRSAKRRALHPYSRSSSPPPGLVDSHSLRPSPHSSISPVTDVSRLPEIPYTMASDTGHDNNLKKSSAISASPVPITGVNVGHRLLEKQGWVPGSTLGVLAPRSSSTSDKEDVREINERMALLEPIQISANIGRRGLGMRSDLPSTR